MLKVSEAGGEAPEAKATPRAAVSRSDRLSKAGELPLGCLMTLDDKGCGCTHNRSELEVTSKATQCLWLSVKIVFNSRM